MNCQWGAKSEELVHILLVYYLEPKARAGLYLNILLTSKSSLINCNSADGMYVGIGR